MTVPADPRQNEILLRASRDLTNKPSMILALRNLFGVPIRALKYYEADDSGTMPKPAVGSNIRPEDRIFFHQHHSAHKYLTGHALNLMTERLIDNFERQVLMADLGHDWTTMPNFWLFFRSMMFEASIEALFGKHMLSLNPELREDFWEFDRHGLSILKGLPPWTNPSGYGARKRAISAVKKWHQFASEHVDATKVSADDPEWEPYWGAKVFKARQQYMGEMHFLDQDAKASEDLGFMFAANANAIPAAGWMALNAFLDPLLLKRARQEVEDCFQDQISTNGTRKLDLTKLCSKPLLQSMYAETLRLCAGIVVGRTPRDGPYKLGEWMFPQGDLILLSARTSAMNPEIWNTGSAEEPHPLDSFWADRFIVYPHDPKSGPLKNPPPSNAKVQSPEFSMRGLTGAWFPYGGGVTMCPGRHFAKQEMIAGMAVLIASYDIEFKVANDFVPQADFSYFPVSGRFPNHIDLS